MAGVRACLAPDGPHCAIAESCFMVFNRLFGRLFRREAAGIPTEAVNKIADGSPHVLDLIASRAVDLVINDAKGPREISDDYKIRRAAVEANIACLTSLDTARALAEALKSRAGPPRSLQEYRRFSLSAPMQARSPSSIA